MPGEDATTKRHNSTSGALYEEDNTQRDEGPRTDFSCLDASWAAEQYEDQHYCPIQRHARPSTLPILPLNHPRWRSFCPCSSPPVSDRQLLPHTPDQSCARSHRRRHRVILLSPADRKGTGTVALLCLRELSYRKTIGFQSRCNDAGECHRSIHVLALA